VLVKVFLKGCNGYTPILNLEMIEISREAEEVKVSLRIVLGKKDEKGGCTSR